MGSEGRKGIGRKGRKGGERPGTGFFGIGRANPWTSGMVANYLSNLGSCT